MKCRRWRTSLALTALILALVSPPVRLGIEAMLLLADLAGHPLSATAVAGVSTTYEVEGRRHAADLYQGEGNQPPLILVPGATPAGKDDPRLVAIAATLARAGWRVLVPDLGGARALQVSTADAVDIADAVRHATAEGGKAAIAAISYAAAPAILAALDPAIAARVAVIAAIGPPHDMARVIGFFTTGHWREAPGQPWRRLSPNAYGKWVFVLSNAGRVGDSGDQVLLAAIARRRLADPGAGIDDLAGSLGPQGRAVMALLDNDDPERVAGLLRALPPAMLAEIRGLDLAARDLAALRAEVLVIHGAGDRIVPVGEGIALAAALPAARLYLLDGLAHADLKAVGAGDALILWRAAYRLLEWRDAMG